MIGADKLDQDLDKVQVATKLLRLMVNMLYHIEEKYTFKTDYRKDTNVALNFFQPLKIYQKVLKENLSRMVFYMFNFSH